MHNHKAPKERPVANLRLCPSLRCPSVRVEDATVQAPGTRCERYKRTPPFAQRVSVGVAALRRPFAQRVSVGNTATLRPFAQCFSASVTHTPRRGSQLCCSSLWIFFSVATFHEFRLHQRSDRATAAWPENCHRSDAKAFASRRERN